MLSYDFETELLEAIEKALAGTGIKPVYVFDKIVPVIKKHSAQQSAQRTDFDSCPECECVGEYHFPDCSHRKSIRR